LITGFSVSPATCGYLPQTKIRIHLLKIMTSACNSDDSSGPVNVKAENAVMARIKPGRRTKNEDPSCQVLGCTQDISEEKHYYKRYRVCPNHTSSNSIPSHLILRNNASTSTPCMRWCQQCACFHPLDSYDGDKRSCRDSLVRVREKRKQRIEKQKQEAKRSCASSGSEEEVHLGRPSLSPSKTQPIQLKIALREEKTTDAYPQQQQQHQHQSVVPYLAITTTTNTTTTDNTKLAFAPTVAGLVNDGDLVHTNHHTYGPISDLAELMITNTTATSDRPHGDGPTAVSSPHQPFPPASSSPVLKDSNVQELFKGVPITIHACSERKLVNGPGSIPGWVKI